jgi:hypothetical protein
MRLTKITLAAGLVVILAGIAWTLSHAPISVARANGSDESYLGAITKKTELCQANETLPAGTTAVRLRAFSYTGPRVSAAALLGTRVITRGAREAGWTGAVVTVPLAPLATTRQVKLCFTVFGNGGEEINLAGEPTERAPTTAGAGTSLPGRVGIEYLRPGRSSWWSLISGVAKRMGFGNAGSGLWNAVFVIGLMGLVGLLSARLILRELR